MPSESAKKRVAIATKLSGSVRLFYPERSNQFLCPTCLSWIPLTEIEKISDAHIIPQAAGGRVTTLLCKDCNSRFGSRRDKWFGEYIRLFRNQHPTILHAKEQRGFFEVGGVRVSGRYAITENGAIEFVIREDKLSPAARLALAAQFPPQEQSLWPPFPSPKPPRSITVTIPLPPLTENKDLVTLGFLTAAYLLWFRELGYSWALQQHLEVVRRQIETETLTVLPRSFSGAIPRGLWDGWWVGFGRINGELALIAGIEERVVLFPPVDRPDFYDRLPPDTLDGARLNVLGRVRFGRHHSFGGPRGVIYGGRLVVSPDVFFKGSHPVILVPEDGPMQLMDPTPDAEFNELKRRYPDRGLKLTGNIKVPETDTGRYN